jgi:hypothetical protein
MISIGSYLAQVRRVTAIMAALLISMPCLASSPTVCKETPALVAAANPLGQEVTTNVVAPVSITEPLSPLYPNIFNFGPHVFKVQYPTGSKFTGVYMTVTAVQISQPEFSKRVAGTAFSNATCVVYNSELGNCIDYQVTCSNASHQAIQCPTSTSSNIDFWSSYDTTQAIINPGFLSTQIGLNEWNNNFDFFYLLKIDPTAHGHTKGWSEFVSVALGTTNPEGLGEFSFNAPLLADDSRIFTPGTAIPVSFKLASTVHCGQPVTDASAGLTVVLVANPEGQTLSTVVLAKQNVFKYANGSYQFPLPTSNFAAGTYILTVFGDAFVTQSTYFTIQ